MNNDKKAFIYISSILFLCAIFSACDQMYSRPNLALRYNSGNNGGNSGVPPCDISRSPFYQKYEQNYLDDTGTPRTDLDWNDFFPAACNQAKGIILFNDATLYLFYHEIDGWTVFGHAYGGLIN